MSLKMNRLTVYAATSVALTASILIHAFAHRPNTYSALVYLAQSNACILILANFFLLTLGTIYFSLQRLCFGPLRAVEIETLYERGWYQATELCLAATIFRDEVGWAFGGLFGGILAGKVWGWLGEGRVEWLQQRPPDNPRLFHTRLSAALLVSLLFDVLMLKYCVDTVLEQARPGMFVMFSFEFAVLGVQSVSTLLRYSIVLKEQLIVKEQQRQRLETRRQEARAEGERAAEAARAEGRQVDPAPAEEVEMDPTDEDVPGWEAKGNWLFALDLATDFLKSILYLTFFSILLVFHGFPVHIIRDLIMTVRSLITRISGFIAYRHATRAMNTLLDATAEDLAQDKTCIVCREDMEVWNSTIPAPQPGQQASQRNSDERQRPKKLPCGHILHKGCLKAWLERQQTCPTCRRPVLPSQAAQQNPPNAANRPEAAQPGHPAPQADRNAGQPAPRPQLQGWRINLGPLRLFVGRGPAEALREQLRQQGNNINNNEEPRAAPATQAPGAPVSGSQARATTQPQVIDVQRRTAVHRQARIENLQQEINRELALLNLQQQQLGLVRGLQNEYTRLSALQTRIQSPAQLGSGVIPGFPSSAVVAAPPALTPSDGAQAFVGDESLALGNPRLPDGMVLPEGWTVLPLTRLGDGNSTIPSFTSMNVAGVGTELPANMIPPGAAGIISAALGLPPLPTGTATSFTTFPNTGSPVSGPASLPGQHTASTVTPLPFANPQNFAHGSSSVTINSNSTPHPPQTAVPIGDLLSRLAQEQEAAAGPSGNRAPSVMAVASPQPMHTNNTRPADALGQAAPTWGFSNASAARPSSSGTESTGTDSVASKEIGRQNGSLATRSAANGHKDVSKGKAKAATVEDEEESEDEEDDEDDEVGLD